MYSRDTLVLDDVITALDSKEKMKQITNGGSEVKAEGLNVRGRSFERGSSSSGKARSKSRVKRKFCNYCHKKGHVIEECYKLKNKEKEKAAAKGKHVSGSGEADVAEVGSDGELLTVSGGGSSLPDAWIMDTGCTFHMCPNRDWFHTYEDVDQGSVSMGDEHIQRIKGMGTVRIRMFDGVIRTFGNVRYVPGLRRNLLSLSSLEEKGYDFAGKDGILRVFRGKTTILKAYRKTSNLYFLDGQTVTGDAAVASKGSSDMDRSRLWHLRLGHMSFHGMSELSRRGLLGGDKVDELEFCEECVYGKQKRVRFMSGKHTTKGPLDYIHSDLWGPARVTSVGGASYMLTIIDDFSRKVWSFFLKHKGDVFSTFRNWKVMIEKQSGREIKYLRTDNGLEFCSEDFNAYCRKEGITRHRTVVHTPQQNGVAERMNRTILEKVRCMLSHSKLPKSFWAEAASTACFVINRSPSRAIEKKTPIELWSGKPADYTDLKPFGCPAYARVDNGKLESRALKCVFLGYKPGVKGYKLWSSELKKVII